HDFVRRQITRYAAFGAGGELIAEANVRERTANHYFVIATTRAVGVEIVRLDSALDQILARRTVLLDRSGRRNVIGGHAVAQPGEHASVANVLHRRGIYWHVVKVGGALDIGRVFPPRVRFPFWNAQLLPVLIALGDVLVVLAEHCRVDGFAHHFIDFFLRRPYLAQVHRLALTISAKRLSEQIVVDASG